MKKSKSLILLCLSALALSSCGLFSTSGDSSSSSSEKENEGYALYGDFVDSNWDNSPATDSIYYIGQNTAYYSVDVTFLDIEDAKFRVVEYGSLTLALGYNELNENSSGVLGTDSSSNILVNPGETYKLTITLGESKSILVTQISGDIDEDDSNTGPSYDGAYQLYGSFNGDVWTEGVPNDTNYVLPYNSLDSSSKYWKRTVTMASAEEYQWDPAFRITEYGTYNTVAGYTSLSVTTNTLVSVAEGDDDNLKLNPSYSGLKLDLTIDLRGSSYTINIDTHDDSFESCNGYIDESESEDTGGSTPNSQYTLYGSFTGDNLWNESPSDSSYILKYDPQESSSKYWKRTVTMASAEEYEWSPAFRIIEYGDYDTLIAGYSTVSVTSNTSISVTADGDNIAVNKDLYAGATLDLTIDLRGSSYTINIDTHDESFTECDGYQKTGEQEQDDTSSNEPPSDLNLSANYYLVGDYDNGWDTNTAVTLSYDPRYSDSLYWQRTITMSSGEGKDYYPGFRVVDSSYGGIVTKGNATIDSASTAYDASLATDADYNFKVPSWGSSYDITIDMRGSEITVLVDYHVDGFDGTVNGRYDGSTKGDDEYEALNIDNNYIMGMDISSIAEVEAAGGKFYDYDGNSVDLINYLASQGINYARLRLWNDPTDSSGNSYLGGGNNLETDLKIAKRCVEAGMKICLDLQYSDFWAHHGQQYAPKTWSSMDATTKISNASSWTTSVLQSFANAGCTPSMVQVGNETNNNEICGLTGNSNDAINFFTTCCNAIRSFDSSIQIVIHYSDDQNVNTYESYLNSLINANCSFDVIGLSYYPFWHENGMTTTNFKNTLSTLDNYYTSKKVCIMEYSYAFTTTWQNGNNTMNNSFYTDEETYAGLSASVSNQKKVIYDINSVAASVNGCLGSFYWEPAWLAVSGSAWASSASASYYQANNVNTSGYSFDTCSWSNQALFDYSGVALDSLKIYNTMWGK